MEFTNIDNVDQKSSTKLSKTGKLFIYLTGGIGIGLTIVCASFVSPAFRKFCLPYIPATDEQIKNIFLALRTNQKTRNTLGSLIDLGSGDGRIVIDAARIGYKSYGIELNPWLVLYSKINSIINHQKTKFYCRDLWKHNLQKYDNIIIFGVEQMMGDLEKKILNECDENCRIVACRFPLPNLKPVKIVGSGINTVWLYKNNK